MLYSSQLRDSSFRCEGSTRFWTCAEAQKSASSRSAAARAAGVSASARRRLGALSISCSSTSRGRLAPARGMKTSCCRTDWDGRTVGKGRGAEAALVALVDGGNNVEPGGRLTSGLL